MPQTRNIKILSQEQHIRVSYIERRIGDIKVVFIEGLRGHIRHYKGSHNPSFTFGSDLISNKVFKVSNLCV